MQEYPSSEQIPQPQQPRSIQVAIPNVKPYATYTLLGFTIFIYLLQVLSPFVTSNQFLSWLGIRIVEFPPQGVDLLMLFGVKFGPYIRAGQVWRLVTPVFLHGSMLHIGFNMYALFIYGRDLERRFGHGRFLLLYFLSAFAGNVFSFLLTPAASLGASTAIFGLIAAETAFLIQNRALIGHQANRLLLNLLYIAIINLFLGFTIQGIDNWGHVGGLLGGLVFAWFGGPRWKLDGLFPNQQLVDEREGHGAVAGTFAVLLIFVPLTMFAWFWGAG